MIVTYDNDVIRHLAYEDADFCKKLEFILVCVLLITKASNYSNFL